MSTLSSLSVFPDQHEAFGHSRTRLANGVFQTYTGRQDIRGRGIHTGDILKDKDGDYWMAVMVRGGFELVAAYDPKVEGEGYLRMPLMDVDQVDTIEELQPVVIGNRFQTAAEIMRQEAALARA